jgi:hypothetical protein
MPYFNHISQHARLEIPMDLRDPSEFSQPRPASASLPFGLVPTEATIGSYGQKHSARALPRVYSVEATFGSEIRCFHRYETGGEPWHVSAASSNQLSPHWHKASGSETQEEMLHSVVALHEYRARGARSKAVGKDEALFP